MHIEITTAIMLKEYKTVRKQYNTCAAFTRGVGNLKFNSLRGLVSEKCKFSFVVSLLGGIIIHMAFLIYHVGNGDVTAYSIVQIGNYIFDRALGRWFTPYVAAWRNDIVMPVFVALVTIFLLSLTVALIVDIFNITDKKVIVLCSALFISQPCVSTIMTLYFCSDTFTMAIFLAVLAAWCLIKLNSNIKIISAAVFIMLSLALYQSHIVLTIIICLFYLIFEALDIEKSSVKALWKAGGGYLLAGALGIVLYFLSVKISLYKWNITLVDYKGVSKMGGLNLPKSFSDMFTYIYQMYLQPKGIGLYQYWARYINGNIINLFVFAIILAILVVYCYRKRVYRDVPRLIFLIVCMAAVPFAWTIIVYMAPEASVSVLISPQMPFLYIFLLLFILRLMPNKKIWINVLKSTSAVLCFLVIYNYVFLANQLYYGSTLASNRVEYIAAEVNSRLDLQGGISPDQKMAVLGSTNVMTDFPDYYTSVYGSKTNILWDGYGGQSGWYKYMLEKFGRVYQPCTYEEYDALVASADFKKMQSYPSMDCIKEIDGILVFKLNDQC